MALQAPASGPPAPAVNAVLFDLGGVFLDWDPRYLYRKLFNGDAAAMEAFLAQVCTPAWHAEQDRGRSISEACAELSRAHPEHSALIRAWEERAEEMVNGVIDGSVEVLAELKAAGVRCYALSNMERENWDRRWQIYEFLQWFDGYFISGHERVMKPEPEYFERALERLGLVPAEVFFVDDRAVNVAAAEALGMRATVFTGAADLRRRLVALGLLGDRHEELAGDLGRERSHHLGQDALQHVRGGGEIEAGEAGATRAEAGARAHPHPGPGQ